MTRTKRSTRCRALRVREPVTPDTAVTADSSEPPSVSSARISAQLPVGVVTALIGGPVFVLLLIRQSQRVGTLT